MNGPNEMDKGMYGEALAMAAKRSLFEIDQLLSGKAEGSLFRLTPAAYARAHAAIANLYAIVREPDLEPTGLASARGDVALQRFLTRMDRVLGGIK